MAIVGWAAAARTKGDKGACDAESAEGALCGFIRKPRVLCVLLCLRTDYGVAARLPPVIQFSGCAARCLREGVAWSFGPVECPAGRDALSADKYVEYREEHVTSP